MKKIFFLPFLFFLSSSVFAASAPLSEFMGMPILNCKADDPAQATTKEMMVFVDMKGFMSGPLRSQAFLVLKGSPDGGVGQTIAMGADVELAEDETGTVYKIVLSDLKSIPIMCNNDGVWKATLFDGTLMTCEMLMDD